MYIRIVNIIHRNVLKFKMLILIPGGRGGRGSRGGFGGRGGRGGGMRGRGRGPPRGRR
jgi:hypothetical protein